MIVRYSVLHCHLELHPRRLGDELHGKNVENVFCSGRFLLLLLLAAYNGLDVFLL